MVLKGAYKMIKNKNRSIDNSVFRAATLLAISISALLIIMAVFFIIAKVSSPSQPENQDPSIPAGNSGEDAEYPFRQNIGSVLPEYRSDATVIGAGSIKSENIVLVDVTEGEIIASRLSGQNNIIYPASMTKMMTLIVVYENLESADDLNDELTVTEAVHKQMTDAEASGAGLEVGETLTVKDLIYAMMLNSDGIASVTLAEYIAGSEREFVALMNQKAEEMGLLNTNFMNCTGLHNDLHYSTCQDMAAIIIYAMKNTFCAEVMKTQSYQTQTNVYSTRTFYNSLLVTNMDEAKAAGMVTVPDNCTVVAGKTGYTEESLHCLATYAVGSDGKSYVVISAKANSKLDCISDYMYVYNTYVQGD